MAFTPVPPQALADAKAAIIDSNTRAAAGDRTVAGPESTALVNLYTALKASGVTSPMTELVNKLPGTVNFQTGA
jgi:hypothetical protein